MTNHINHDGEGSPTIEPPASFGDSGARLTEGPGTKIGRFKLLELIGEGGFGVVFMAEQEQPIRRHVALKIIKLGMDTRQVVARFEAERQALAMMDHPHIAKVLDGGSTDTGRPYFVMELVRGIPITEYCDKNKLDIRKRLDLFMQVCQAVQHAHQKGLIHRDLKPSNVLVSTQDDQPRAKVIDFGVAKATQSQLTDKTLFTQFHQMVGTPVYMSPEQADGDLDIDTRSDVYSLGVLLYELLAGSTPFDAKELCSNAYGEMQRIIREVEPPTPSTRLSTLRAMLPSIAARRDLDPGKLKTALRGELDWIVMRCLEKDRNRRYQSASELNDDIHRYLNYEPVKARAATKMYRLKKFVRRNKSSVFAGSMVVLAMLAGLGLATVGFMRARTERDRAVAATAMANDNFREARGAVEDLLQISDERLKDQPGLQPLRIELMKAAIDRYEPFLAQPMADPTPREELARLYARYGQMLLERREVFDASVMTEFEKARKLQEQLLKEHPGDRSLREDLGWTCILEEWRPHDMPPSPEQVGRQAIAIFRSLVAEDPSDPFARDDLVWALWRINRYVDDAEGTAMVNEAVAIGEQLVKEYPESAEFRRELANALYVKSGALLGSKPTPQSAALAMPFSRRGFELDESIWADFKAGRPEALLPELPKGDEARIVGDSPMWAEFDVGLSCHRLAMLYRIEGDWRHASEMYDQSTPYYEDLAEHNPSVATFTQELEGIFNYRVISAENAKARGQVAAWSKDAVAFWNRQLELHPELPELQNYAQTAREQEAQVTRWLVNPTTQPE